MLYRITEINSIQFVLFGMQNRTYSWTLHGIGRIHGAYMHTILIPEMRPCELACA
jgi:hypothetical protein